MVDWCRDGGQGVIQTVAVAVSEFGVPGDVIHYGVQQWGHVAEESDQAA